MAQETGLDFSDQIIMLQTKYEQVMDFFLKNMHVFYFMLLYREI